MRLLDINPNLKNFVQTQTINGIDYQLLIFLELKADRNKILTIPWSSIQNFTYIDDINNVGVKGELVIENVAGTLDKCINNTDLFYIGYYSYNAVTNFEENLYFSIISSDSLNTSQSSSSCYYRFILEESFLVEGANRNINAMGMAVKNFSTSTNKKPLERISDNIGFTTPIPTDISVLESKNLYDLLLYAAGLITSDLKINTANNKPDITNEDLYITTSETTGRITDFDIDSFNYFKNTFPTDLVGEAIFKNISLEESVLGFIEKINNNVYFPKVEKIENNKPSSVNFNIGDIGSARSENISFIKTSDKVYNKTNIKGHRRLTLRNIKDTFTTCFQKNIVYEIIAPLDNSTKINKDLKASFLTPTFFYDLKLYPVNIVFINNRWCDHLVAPVNQSDFFSGILLKFNDILSTFEKDYLHNKVKSNIVTSTIESRGIARKSPPFNDNNLNFAVSSKIIKTFFTLNNMVEVSLPGNTFRKANEIIYVDKNIVSSNKAINENDQVTYSNIFEGNYYFITRVVHSFKGQDYRNSIFLSSFCQPIKNN